MTNEEFQRLVLEKLGSIESELKETKNKVTGLDNKVTGLEKTVNSIKEQTVILTEFREETNKKLDTLIEDNKSMHEILGDHEVSIRTLRRRII